MMVAMLAMGWLLLTQFPIAESFTLRKTTYPPPPTDTNSHLQRRRQTLRIRTELFAVEQKDNLSRENVSNKETKEIFVAAKDDLSIGKNIGSGSYGTVHLLQSNTKQSTSNFVGKRPWRYEELLLRKRKKAAAEEENVDVVAMKERAVRCMYYWRVEQHCFTKLPPHPQLPLFLGTSTTRNDKEKDDNEWMVFGFVGKIQPKLSGDDTIIETPVPAPTMQDLMRLDIKESTLAKHELRNIAKALGTTSYEETLDTILPSLLVVLQHIHKNKIVHRDIKPANLLVHDNNILLMDFGSAADLEPSSSSLTRGNGLMGSLFSSQKQRVGLESGNRVAVSPVYTAPEVFIDINDAPTSFDIFSSGLIFCQLLFGYLETRVDAGFRQQLVDDADCDLNVWLNNELSSKLRPAGLGQALDYLIERPGLWDLLAEMLSKEPRKRPSAREALQRWHDIQSYREGGNNENENINANNNHSFFSLVVEALETCEIPSISRPLNFVATFSRSRSLGLVLSEKDEGGDDSDNDNEENQFLWKAATKDSFPGEVFVKDIVTDGQADELGIFEIGDRLSGIGELPFIDGGFEKAVGMLQDQPKATKNVRLHFDRTSVRFNEAIDMKPPQASIQIADRGAWSSKGRRKAQEDTFILHEIHDATDRSVLVSGVMDGHGGTRASQIVSEDLPSLLSNQLVIKDRSRSVYDALEDSWISICKSYQQNCLDDGECIADYDPMEGILQADTGSKDLKAGTTCSMMALDETSSELTLLNCGDSRSLVVSEDGKVKFATLDHTPQSEEERLLQGIQQGLDYSLPKCRLSRWSLKVGDYEYAVGRSLEGVFATSKGIVSDPDVSTLTVQAGDILVSATDGLWNVMDSNEVAMDLYKMRTKNGMSAPDAASTLCSMAIRKGSSDNVSAVVVYL
jgi:serine/threonine protein phosphatase PrpC/serine/threonine protein kinase